MTIQPGLRLVLALLVVVLCVLGAVGVLPPDPRVVFVLVGLTAIGLVL